MITQNRLNRAYRNLRALGTSNIGPTDLATITGSLAAPEARALALAAILTTRSTETDIDTAIEKLSVAMAELHDDQDTDEDTDTADEA